MSSPIKAEYFSLFENFPLYIPIIMFFKSSTLSFISIFILSALNPINIPFCFPIDLNGIILNLEKYSLRYDEIIKKGKDLRQFTFELTSEFLDRMVNEKENLNRKISRIEWAQDFGRLTESPAGVEMSTSEITDALWKFFIDKGLPEITAAAIMGNIQQESGFILDSLSYDGNNSIGLCQWTFGRRTALQEFARNMGLHETDLEAQMEYLWKEKKILNKSIFFY